MTASREDKGEKTGPARSFENRRTSTEINKNGNYTNTTITLFGNFMLCFTINRYTTCYILGGTTKCPICSKKITRKNLKSHIENRHKIDHQEATNIMRSQVYPERVSA